MPADTTAAPAAQPGETDRMRLIDAELRARGKMSLPAFLRNGWTDEGKSWDRIASDLRLALEGTPYAAIPRETVIQYARRYGVAPAERPKGMARVRRNRPTD